MHYVVITPRARDGLSVDPSRPPRWVGIGIRIEDDVLVTEEGNEVLTAGVPKEIKDLER